MKKLLMLSLIALLALTGSAAARSAAKSAPHRPHAGRLDKAFGREGIVMTPSPAQNTEGLPAPALFAWAGGGRILAADGTRLLRYARDGRLDSRFGQQGTVIVAPPSERLPVLSGLGVDSGGRILVAGTVFDPTASVFVSRYLPNGELDRSFGEDGVVVTDLGFPAPPMPPQEGISHTFPISDPVVEGLGLTVDDAGRPWVSGAWMSGWQFCYPSTADTPQWTGYAARFTVDGEIDPSFSGDGVVIPDPAKEVDISPSTNGGGVLVLGARRECLRGSPAQPELARIGRNGEVDQSFGSAGLIALDFYDPPAIGQNRSGRILLLGNEPGRKSLQMLTPHGRPDPGFGLQGTRILSAAPAQLLGIDPEDRPVVARSAGFGPSAFYVARLTKSGAIDRSFGNSGRVATRFDGVVEAERVLVGGAGKIVVAGTMGDDEDRYLVLVRYLGDS
jgi:uncharacterized delta-60 repeat protein